MESDKDKEIGMNCEKGYKNCHKCPKKCNKYPFPANDFMNLKEELDNKNKPKITQSDIDDLLIDLELFGKKEQQ